MSQRPVSLRLPCLSEPTHTLMVQAAAPTALPESADCPTCQSQRSLLRAGLAANGGLLACLGCAAGELYTRKDFPPAIGIGIVVLAAVLVPFVPYYGSLFAAAALDCALYRWAPDVVVCYHCHGQHRAFPVPPRHPRFDRTIEERLRYGARAVMGSAPRPGGTADAPEPEH